MAMRTRPRGGAGYQACSVGSALHVMLFLENLIRALLIFNGLLSCHCQRALLVYHYPKGLGSWERLRLNVGGTGATGG